MLALYSSQKTNKVLLIIILFNTFLLLSGCSTQQNNKVIFNDGSIEISVPAALEIYEVDGKSVRTPSLNNGNYLFYIPPGNHTMAVQYVENWNNDNDGSSASGRVVKWQPVGLKVNFKKGERYNINYTRPKNYETAISLKETPNITVESTKGEIISGETLDTPNLIESLLSGRFRYGAPSTGASQKLKAKNTQPVEKTNTKEPNTLNKLKSLWEKASDNEKRDFWIWLAPEK
ncbi:MAG: DUF2057 family protein [Cellvibrionaceae bacterium]